MRRPGPRASAILVYTVGALSGAGLVLGVDLIRAAVAEPEGRCLAYAIEDTLEPVHFADGIRFVPTRRRVCEAFEVKPGGRAAIISP